MNTVVRPPIPYSGPILGGLHEGKMIEIKGHAPYGSESFTVNLLTGIKKKSDSPLHISVRFNERVVVRNTKKNGSWGTEERLGMFPFAAGQDFIMLILVESLEYKIAVNNQHCWEFKHRVPFCQALSIMIDGSVQVEQIEFVDRKTPQQIGVCINVYPPVGPTGIINPGIQPAVCPPAFVRQPPQNPSGIYPVVPTGFQPSSNLAPVYNPNIPYAYPIYGGLKPGMMICISGRPTANPLKFTINLQNGTAPYPPPDIALHFEVRFFNFSIVRNTRHNNVWGNEENLVSHFPFQAASNFDMIIKVEGDRYMIAVNGQHFLEFKHRLAVLPLYRIDTLYIENDIVVSAIRFT